MFNKLKLYDVFKSRSILGLKYNSDYKDIINTFGEPVSPMCKLSKNSKIFSLQYNTLLFYITQHKVIDIMIDLENPGLSYDYIDDFNRFKNYRLSDWLNFSDEMNLNVTQNGPITTLCDTFLKLNIDQDGHLHIVNIGNYNC